jgi:hypothetical protein
VLSGDVKYTYDSEEEKVSPKANSRLTAVGMLCRVFIGEDTKGEMLKAHANRVIEEMPSVKRPDFYRWYYATLAMFQMGGEYWEKWNGAMKESLLATQRKGECEDGSWDPDRVPYGAHGGRVFSTALACLSLEVYYRYLPILQNIDQK